MSRWAVVSAVGLLIALVSLGLNFYLLRQLWQVERLAAAAVAHLSRPDDDDRLRFPVRIPAGTAIGLTVPIDERVIIGIDTILPIRTHAVLPIRSPLGNYDLRVPVLADVPVNLRAPVRIQHTLRLNVTTPDDIVVPIEFRLSDIPLDSLIRVMTAP
jgi:hypothetical protein